MGQCNLYIAAAQDEELKELISLYLSDVCDPNVAEMQTLLESAGYELPLPLEAAPSNTDPVSTEAIDDTTIALGQWFATRAFMELWHTGAMGSPRTDAATRSSATITAPTAGTSPTTRWPYGKASSKPFPPSPRSNPPLPA
ncbi:hypothetical protein [Janibacter indicus]|uniref:hypothetical protein n=1 Tax=Janibacter indicus TaxID=857417 RepID=UPI000B027D34|nr:hypothetical protein [Janibacter indicus]